MSYIDYVSELERMTLERMINAYMEQISPATKAYFAQVDKYLLPTIILTVARGSIHVSLIQRYAEIGYPRAGHILYILRQLSIVNGDNRGKPLRSQVSESDLIPLIDSISLEDFIPQTQIKKDIVGNATLHAKFRVEYPNRLRIYTDSINLIKTTKTIGTLDTRYNDILEYYDWAYKMKDAGMHINLPASKDEALSELNRIYNDGIARICQNIVALADTARKAKNAISRLDGMDVLLREAENKQKTTDLINDLIIRLKNI